MARTRAADHDDKRALIFDRAAELFAEQGFDATSIAAIAARCRASKSWIYHYFASKEAILFAILDDHMHRLHTVAAEAIGATREPEQKLRAVLRALMAVYAGARAKHVVLLNELDRLPAEERQTIRALERQLVDQVQALLVELNPALMRRRAAARPVTMLLFGMINWTHTWYRPDGEVDPDHLADLASELFVGGLAAAGPRRRSSASGAAAPARRGT